MASQSYTIRKLVDSLKALNPDINFRFANESNDIFSDADFSKLVLPADIKYDKTSNSFITDGAEPFFARSLSAAQESDLEPVKEKKVDSLVEDTNKINNANGDLEHLEKSLHDLYRIYLRDFDCNKMDKSNSEYKMAKQSKNDALTKLVSSTSNRIITDDGNLEMIVSSDSKKSDLLNVVLKMSENYDLSSFFELVNNEIFSLGDEYNLTQFEPKLEISKDSIGVSKKFTGRNLKIEEYKDAYNYDFYLNQAKRFKSSNPAKYKEARDVITKVNRKISSYNRKLNELKKNSVMFSNLVKKLTQQALEYQTTYRDDKKFLSAIKNGGVGLTAKQFKAYKVLVTYSALEHLLASLISEINLKNDKNAMINYEAIIAEHMKKENMPSSLFTDYENKQKYFRELSKKRREMFAKKKLIDQKFKGIGDSIESIIILMGNDTVEEKNDVKSDQLIDTSSQVEEKTVQTNEKKSQEEKKSEVFPEPENFEVHIDSSQVNDAKSQGETKELSQNKFSSSSNDDFFDDSEVEKKNNGRYVCTYIENTKPGILKFITESSTYKKIMFLTHEKLAKVNEDFLNKLQLQIENINSQIVENEMQREKEKKDIKKYNFDIEQLKSCKSNSQSGLAYNAIKKGFNKAKLNVANHNNISTFFNDSDLRNKAIFEKYNITSYEQLEKSIAKYEEIINTKKSKVDNLKKANNKLFNKKNKTEKRLESFKESLKRRHYDHKQIDDQDSYDNSKSINSNNSLENDNESTKTISETNSFNKLKSMVGHTMSDEDEKIIGGMPSNEQMAEKIVENMENGNFDTENTMSHGRGR